MKVAFNKAGELDIRPSATSSQNDFDFYVGKWNIVNKKLRERLSNCDEWVTFEATSEMKKILHGFGNSDIFNTLVDGRPFEGMTLRLFNPVTNLWTIYWADSDSCKMETPVVGSFDGPIGHFFAKAVFNGGDIIMVYRWDATDPKNPVWSQAFSADKGETWEWNWYMYKSKAS